MYFSKKNLLVYTAFVTLLAVFFSVSSIYAYDQINNKAKFNLNESAEQQTTTADKTSFSLPGVNEDTISNMVDTAGNAVVKIETTSKVKSNYDPFLSDPFFRQFFGGSNLPEERETHGLGSGFLISKDGYILTNEHVITNATDIMVQVTGYDKSFPAQVIGKEADLDLAVLKISGANFPTLTLGDSDKVNVGNWVVAIGNPLGLDHTVTVGVISAKSRPVTIDNKVFKNLLQTDASINPGNSGGPLLNLRGEVIGINTAINAEAQGIGFAIPSSTVQEVLQELITKGKVVKPWIGIYMQGVTKELADYFGLEKTDGAIITSVIPNSPAYLAGLQRGDVILEFNGTKIKTPDELQEAVKKVQIGQSVNVLVWKDKKLQTITMKITEKQN